MKLTKVLFSLGALAFSMALISSANAQTNIALNKKISISKPSNYALTKDKNPAQLVDGKYAGENYDSTHKTSSLWVQEGSLTWREGTNPIIFYIDLGKVMPISGISYSTAGGAAGVQFPLFAGIAVSEDNKSWHYQGDLMSLSRKNGMPELDKYSKYRFTTHDLKTKGRYIALAVMQFPYTVTDEIEVYSGDNAWLELPLKGRSLKTPDAVKDLAFAVVLETFVQRRVTEDIKDIRALLNSSSFSTAQKSTFSVQLKEAATANGQTTLADGNIKTILPISEAHQKVMATYGQILAAENVAPLTVWKQHRYAWLPLLGKPQTNQKPEVNIAMLGNQFRSDSLLITNASGEPQTVQLDIQNPPKDAQEGWLQINRAVWMDTYRGTPVVDALLPISENKITIPAGFTQPIWFIVDSSKVPAGRYKSTLLVDGKTLPFNLNISKIAMNRPRLSLTMWDYTDPNSMKSGSSGGITSQNYADAHTMMKTHYVDSPWARRGILPYPKAEDFDAKNNLRKALDFAMFDQWIAEWPDAKQYFVFVSASENTTFGGAKRGTAEFNARLGNWAKVLSDQMKKLGKEPGELALLIVDEPGLFGAWQDEVTADWGKAINAKAPELTLISDPVWKDPKAQSHQAAATQMDILMPNTQRYFGSYDKPSQDYFEKQRLEGKSLWLYSCIAPVRLFNPQQYFRGQAWRVFSINGDGMGFWAFGDLGGAPTTWHDYQITRGYVPAFIDEDTVYNSIHWEAVREGVQDFEELAMLRDAIAKTKNAALKKEAQQVMDDALAAVLDTQTDDLWHNEKSPDYTDLQLQNVREMLGELTAISAA